MWYRPTKNKSSHTVKSSRHSEFFIACDVDFTKKIVQQYFTVLLELKHFCVINTRIRLEMGFRYSIFTVLQHRNYYPHFVRTILSYIEYTVGQSLPDPWSFTGVICSVINVCCKLSLPHLQHTSVSVVCAGGGRFACNRNVHINRAALLALAGCWWTLKLVLNSLEIHVFLQTLGNLPVDC